MRTAIMCLMRSNPQLVRATCIRSERSVPGFCRQSENRSVCSAGSSRAHNLKYAQLLKYNLAVAPIYSGLYGGMNEIFHAQYPGKIVPLAIVLPPGSGS